MKYAGEIIVDVKNCTYRINQGSGIYQPNAGTRARTYEHLEKIAKLFEEKVGAAPTSLWNTQGSPGANTFTYSTSPVVPGCTPSP